MAKNAEKKNYQNMVYWANIMQITLALVNMGYLFSLLARIRANEYEWFYSDVIWVLVYAWVEKTTYGMITDELERGLKPNYSLDIFGVVVLSHAVSIVSDYWGGKVLWLMPLYVAMKGGSFFFGYMSNKSKSATTAEDKEVDPAEAKKQAKKERKEARQEKMGGRVKYAKH